MRALLALMLLLAGLPVRAGVLESERLATGAMATADPVAALALARRALAETAEFSPTAFVRAGRKGEVVEDAFLEARTGYRQHRALVYEAMGDALDRQGQAVAAARYLRRAVLLHATPVRVGRLVDALLDAGAAAEALHLLRVHGSTGLAPSLFERAADVLGLPSAQAEIDRARAAATKPALQVAPVPVPLTPGARLSTGGPFAWTPEPTVVYVAEADCRSCSRDLELLARVLPPQGVRTVMVAEDPDRDAALRQVMELYKYRWPVVVGRGFGRALPVKAGRALVVGRRGWGAVVVDPPFDGLAAAVDIVRRSDVAERLPRERWNRGAVEVPAPATPPGLTDEGLAPGDDLPPPAAWERARAAYRERRWDAALAAFAELEKDGWLLPPEARFNRALALGGQGRAAQARSLLLGIGDSRFLDEVDRALEAVGARP